MSPPQTSTRIFLHLRIQARTQSTSYAEVHTSKSWQAQRCAKVISILRSNRCFNSSVGHTRALSHRKRQSVTRVNTHAQAHHRILYIIIPRLYVHVATPATPCAKWGAPDGIRSALRFPQKKNLCGIPQSEGLGGKRGFSKISH